MIEEIKQFFNRDKEYLSWEEYKALIDDLNNDAKAYLKKVIR